VVKSSIPQGTEISLILIACFIINDVSISVRNCTVQLYADDLQLYFVDEDIIVLSNMVSIVNEFLVFNPGKTQSVLITGVDPILLTNGLVF
jgi:hypothetical protein